MAFTGLVQQPCYAAKIQLSQIEPFASWLIVESSAMVQCVSV